MGKPQTKGGKKRPLLKVAGGPCCIPKENVAGSYRCHCCGAKGGCGCSFLKCPVDGLCFSCCPDHEGEEKKTEGPPLEVYGIAPLFYSQTGEVEIQNIGPAPAVLVDGAGEEHTLRLFEIRKLKGPVAGQGFRGATKISVTMEI